MTYYIIIGPARSGTTFIHKLLASHPEVSALSDEVNIDSIFFEKGINFFTFGNETQSEYEKGFTKIIEALCEIKSDKRTKASGIKVALHYPEQAIKTISLLRDYLPHFKVIIIKRRDLVAQYGSFLLAHITGRTHSDFKISKEKKTGAFNISKFWFNRYLKNMLFINDILAKIKESNECLELYYEDFVKNNTDEKNRLLYNFIGVSDFQHVYRQQKVSPSAEDYILNYNILRKEQLDLENKKVKAKIFKRPFFNYYLLYKIFVKRYLKL